MSIQKKSLISTLKTAKKAKVASQGNDELNSKPSNAISKRQLVSSKRQLVMSKRQLVSSKRQLM
jgi:hypothetical protein